MSYYIHCAIICDTCKRIVFERTTKRSSDARHIVSYVRRDFEKSGGSQVLRGRFHRSAHYCRECQDKPMGKVTA